MLSVSDVQYMLDLVGDFYHVHSKELLWYYFYESHKKKEKYFFNIFINSFTK